MTPASTLLKEARLEAGLTQATLAGRAGMPQSVVARLERAGSNPTWDTFVRTLRATGHEVELVPARSTPAELDLGQLRERLALPPGERLRVFQASQRSLARLKAGARRRARR